MLLFKVEVTSSSNYNITIYIGSHTYLNKKLVYDGLVSCWGPEFIVSSVEFVSDEAYSWEELQGDSK